MKTGMPVVSLLGYTSSGKTTLYNLLTDEHKETSSRLVYNAVEYYKVTKTR